MSKHVALFLVILAFASFTTPSAQDIKCVDDTHFEYLGTVFECVQDDPDNPKVCNRNYKNQAGEDEGGEEVAEVGAESAKICDVVDNVCKYRCDDNDERAIILGTPGFATKCEAGKICNNKKDSCSEMCTDRCTFKFNFECDGDSKVKIYGLSLSCPAGTVCNKDKRRPCAICHSQSGGKTPVRNWLTIEN